MELWKSHVRAALFQRDCLHKDAFTGLFTKVSRLEELLSLHASLWEDLERGSRPSSNTNGIKKCSAEEKEFPKLYLQLKEGEQVRQKLAQTVSDLTSDLYLKEAELQYCHSQVARYRKEAVLLGRGAFSLKSDLSDFEYKLECQTKELAVLRLENGTMKRELEMARQEKEELLERWLEEKREEAERLNIHNAALERWNHYAGRLSKRVHAGPRRHSRAGTNSRIMKRDKTDRTSAKHE